MAENQPAPAPAADPANPQSPGQQPEANAAGNQQPAAQPSNSGPSGATPPAADAPSGPSGAPAVTLTDEQKTYLKSQGIAEDQLSSPDAILKLVNHATTLKKTATETQAQLEKIKGAVSPEQVPQNPFTPIEPASQQPQDGQPAAKSGLDPVTAFTLSTSLAANFPEVKEDLLSGKLYQDMSAQGIPLTDANGQVNVNGITNFASFRKQQIELEKKLEEAGKPPEGVIPPVDPGVPQQPASDAPMTKQMALAILAQDPGHARAAEAKQFIENPSK